jgi:dUTP pyrophosphatase
MINFYCDHNLKNTLLVNEVESYAPAYSGESAGLDLYNSGPSVTIKSVKDFTYQNKILIPTGLRIIVPEGYVALIQERGSITKTPLKVRAGVIDRGYTGEIFVNAVNVSQNEYTLQQHQKLPFQLVVVKCDNHFQEIKKQEYLNLTSENLRKDGIVGSSD